MACIYVGVFSLCYWLVVRGRISMSNLWFFRLRSGSNPPPPVDSMDRRRSSSERGLATGNQPPNARTQVIVDLDRNFRPYSKTTTKTIEHRGSSSTIPLSQTMSRIHSARSSTASYCGGPFGPGGPYAIYGDVPPLHRKSFLSGNVPASDSMDNIALLIPRFVLNVSSLFIYSSFQHSKFRFCLP